MNRVGHFLRWRIVSCMVLMGLLGVAGGCAGYNGQAKAFMDPFERGDMTTAVAQVVPQAEKEKGADELLLQLEAGAILQSAGEYERSNEFFDHATSIVEGFDEKADVSVSQEAKASVTNLSYLPYRGYDYDRVMMETFKALNWMYLGDKDHARVALKRAFFRQQDAVTRNSQRIAEAQEEASQEQQESIKKVNDNSQFNQEMDQAYSDLKQYAAYTNYVNPFTEFLQGLYMMAEGVDANDSEQAAKSLERVAGMSPNNSYIQQDRELADQIASGGKLPALTYVIFATGSAPSRDSIRIDLPIALLGKFSGGVDYVGVSFPKLVFNNNYSPYLTVQAGDASLQTAIVSNMDAVVSQDFKNELPVVITKTIVAAAVKAAAAYGLNKGTESNFYLNIATRVATTAYQAGMNQADLRTWRTLPKQFQYCRFPTPESGTIQIASQGTGTPTTVQLKPGRVNVIYVRSVVPSSPLLISQFDLGPGSTVKPADEAPATPTTQPSTPATPTADNDGMNQVS